MHILKKHKLLLCISLLSLVGGFLRFYNLNWGSPLYFHPDERNIASSVIQINFPNQTNPHFFAYGSFPIYLIYFTAYLVNLFTKSQLLFEQAIIISRFYSAILSALLIPSVYFLGERLGSKRVGLIAAIFCTFSVGLIQFAHFGTFEMWLTFLEVWLFYFSLNLVKKLGLKNIFAVGIIFGLLMATKVSSLPLLAIPAFSILLNYFFTNHSRYIGIFLVIIFCVALAIFIATSPFTILDFSSFLSSVRYEFSVALGNLPVFYTGEFFNSIPIIFQFTKIYPFLLNPILTIIFIPSFFYLIFKGIKNKNPQYLMLNTCYLMLFLPQAFLFAKWTRYIVPTLPFMYLIIAIFLNDSLKKSVLSMRYLVLCILISSSFIFALSYFITAFAKEDTRIKASTWAKENIKNNPNIISEVYDLGIIPFNPFFSKITLFNFYDLDNAGVTKMEELNSLILKSEYIILPSNRIMKTRLTNAKQFPVGHRFYTSLFNGRLGYTKIYQTPCDIFCKITYLGDPIFSFEETANVFDRPTVFIFKKV